MKTRSAKTNESAKEQSTAAQFCSPWRTPTAKNPASVVYRSMKKVLKLRWFSGQMMKRRLGSMSSPWLLLWSVIPRSGR